METDAAVGEVLSALDIAGISDETMVVFTSDNGCASRTDDSPVVGSSWSRECVSGASASGRLDTAGQATAGGGVVSFGR